MAGHENILCLWPIGRQTMRRFVAAGARKKRSRETRKEKRIGSRGTKVAKKLVRSREKYIGWVGLLEHDNM
jgi:hypothetical protein